VFPNNLDPVVRNNEDNKWTERGFRRRTEMMGIFGNHK
jgi:hypothetical protein